MWLQGGGPEQLSLPLPVGSPSVPSEHDLPPGQHHGPSPSFHAATMLTTTEAAAYIAVETTSPRSSSASVFLATTESTTHDDNDDGEEASNNNYSCRSSPQVIDDELSDNNESLMRINNPQPLHTNRWASPALFFLGSILYVWSALCDIRQESTWGDDTADDYNYNADADDANEERQQQPLIDFYVILTSAAALCYVCDAACSFVHLPRWMGLPFELVCCGRIHYHDHHHHHQAATPGGQHQETRSSMWSWAVSASFGLAALMDLASSLTVNWTVHPQITNVCAISAVYVYLLNAAILLYGKQQQQQQQQQADDISSSSVVTAMSRSEILEYRGDILFGIGSCIDVALTSVYFRHNISDAHWKLVNRGNLLSTLLWLLDSLLYIAAEYYCDEDDQEDDNNSILADRHQENDEEMCLPPSPPAPKVASGNVDAVVGFTQTLEEPLLTDDNKASSSGPLAAALFSSSFSTLPVVVAVHKQPRNADAATGVFSQDEANRERRAKAIGVMA